RLTLSKLRSRPDRSRCRASHSGERARSRPFSAATQGLRPVDGKPERSWLRCRRRKTVVAYDARLVEGVTRVTGLRIEVAEWPPEHALDDRPSAHPRADLAGKALLSSISQDI